MNGLTNYKYYLSQLIAFDHHLFHLINQEWTNKNLDRIMTYLTSFHETQYVLMGLALLILIFYRKRGIKILLGCVIAVGISDTVAARIVKPYFHRSRPQFVERNIRILVPPQNSPSFVSNHAANSFSAATFLGLAIPGLYWTGILIATAIAYSRVYVGVHYPLDVFGGGILGIFIGATLWLLLNRFLYTFKIPTIGTPYWSRKMYYQGRKKRKMK